MIKLGYSFLFVFCLLPLFHASILVYGWAFSVLLFLFSSPIIWKQTARAGQLVNIIINRAKDDK